MASNILNIKSCHSVVSNLHFDTILTTGAAISVYFQKQGNFFWGLESFAMATLADRTIMWLYTRDFRIPVNSDEKLIPAIFSGVMKAGLEEAVYSYVLLSNRKDVYSTTLRCIVSFFLGLTASRSIRHSDSKEQDLWDAALGLGWAIGREIIVRKTSPRIVNIFSILSNSLIFGSIERMKFTGPLRHYKLIAGIAFRGILDCYRLFFSPQSHFSWVQPLTAHVLFNISRCLPSR